MNLNTTNKKMICPICNSNKIENYYNLYDDRYAYPGIFKLKKCLECKHLFLEQNFTDDDFIELYSKYYPRESFEIDTYKPYEQTGGFFAWLRGDKSAVYRWIPENIKILDIGCGFGESLGYHKARGCDVSGVEADSNIQKVIDKYDYDVKVGLFNANDYEKNSFDYVTMNQVIEHLSNPIDVLNGIHDILKPNGFLILSTPNANGMGVKLFGKRWINWHTPYHLHFFSTKSFEIMAKNSGFKIVKIKTVTASRWLNYQWIHSIFYPELEKKSLFWSYGILKVPILMKIIFKGFSAFHRLGIDSLITRLFDSIEKGDNYIIKLQKI